MFHIPQDARDPRVHEEKLERIEALWKHGEDFTRFGHSACQDMVHSCARFKQGEITQKSRCIHFGNYIARRFLASPFCRNCRNLCGSATSGWRSCAASSTAPPTKCWQSTRNLRLDEQPKNAGGGLVRLICTCMLKTWGMICWIYWDEDLQRHGLWTQDKWQFTETLRQGWDSFSIEAIWSFQLSRSFRRLMWKWQVGNIHCERNCWLIFAWLFFVLRHPVLPRASQRLKLWTIRRD